MAVTPTGQQAFADAQERLREALGVDAVFILSAADTWPAGTPLDPETGRPYDPFLEPETAGETVEVTKRCSFVHRPLTAADPTVSPIGAIDSGSAALIVDELDYPDVANARRVRIGPEEWRVELWRYDEALRVARWLAYLEHA